MADLPRSNRPLFAAASLATGQTSKQSNPLNWTSVGSSFVPTQSKSRETERVKADVSPPRSSSSSKKPSKHHKDSGRDRKSHGHREKERHKSHRHKSPSPPRSNLLRKTFREETGLSHEAAFRIDRNADRNNLAFDSLYRMHVPFYNKKECIDHCGVRGTSRFDCKEEKSRYFSKSLSYSKLKRLKAIDDAARTKILPEYLPLTTSDKEEDMDDADPLSNPSVIFRSLDYTLEQINTQPSQPSKKQQLYNETQKFNESLRENPHDVEKWLAFVKFQDQIFDRSIDKNENLTSSLIEKKLSILEKAIESNPRSIDLLIERLNLVKFVWEDEKVNSEWKKLTFLYANNCRVWREYIFFLKSCTSFFSTSKVINVYSKVFQTLSNIIDGKFCTHKADDSLQLELVQLFSEYCTFLLETGYTERSIASWQAIIEFNFFTLSSKYEASDLTAFFEPFWDSGVPRVGESNALGWEQTMKLQRTSNCPPSHTQRDALERVEEKITLDAKSPGDLWSKLEEVREAHFWLPVRGSALESLEDPYQSVLFDDIKFCLLQVDSSAAKKWLIDSFFKHLYQLDLERSAQADDREEFLQMMHAAIDLLSCHHSSYKHSLIQSYCRHLYSRTKDELQMNVSRKHLHTLLQDTSTDELSICCIIHLYLAKLMVKVNHSNRDEIDLVNEQFIKSITRTVERKSDITSDLPCVLEYCLMKLGVKDVDEITAQKRVSSPCDRDDEEAVKRLIVTSVMQSAQYMNQSFVLSAPVILKTTRKLSDLSEKRSLAWILCYAIFTLVTKGHSKCDSIVEQYLPVIEGSERESLLLFRLKIYLHQSFLSFGPLREVRQLLKQAVTQYPTNASLFAVLTAVESTFAGVASCTGHFFSDSSRDTTFTRHECYWLAYIAFEWNRLRAFNDSCVSADSSIARPYDNGLSRRLRSIFERALAPHAAPHSSRVWTLYLHFEIDEANFATARSLLYRALQSCPWNKQLYVLAIAKLDHSLVQTVDLMAEKEIRLRTLAEEADLLFSTAHSTQEEGENQ